MCGRSREVVWMFFSCCVVAVFQVKASSLIGRERCHLQSMGTQVPPRATPQQTSCWDLLPSPPLATIHGGRIQTEELIAFPAPLTSSSACPVLTAPSPLNNTTIIYPLIIGHSTPASSCIVFVPVKSANSEGLTDKASVQHLRYKLFQGPHFFGIFVTPPCYGENAQQMKNRLLDALDAISKFVAGHPSYRVPRILNDNARWHCLPAAKNTS